MQQTQMRKLSELNGHDLIFREVRAKLKNQYKAKLKLSDSCTIDIILKDKVSTYRIVHKIHIWIFSHSKSNKNNVRYFYIYIFEIISQAKKYRIAKTKTLIGKKRLSLIFHVTLHLKKRDMPDLQQ